MDALLEAMDVLQRKILEISLKACWDLRLLNNFEYFAPFSFFKIPDNFADIVASCIPGIDSGR